MTDDLSGGTQERSRPRLEIDWLKTAAGALAAVSSAVVLSTLGAAGTLIGAALGSVVLTVGNALYSQGLERSRRSLTHAQRRALRKVGVAEAAVQRAGLEDDPAVADSQLGDAEQRLEEARRDLDDADHEAASAVPAAAAPGWKERFTQLPWRRIGLVAAGLFVVAVVLITAFELLAGRSVASYTGGTDGTGGTSLTRLGGGGSDQPRDQQPTPTDGGSPTDGSSAPASEEPSTGSSDTTEVEPSTPMPESTEPGLTETPSPTLPEPTSPAPTPTPQEPFSTP